MFLPGADENPSTSASFDRGDRGSLSFPTDQASGSNAEGFEGSYLICSLLLTWAAAEPSECHLEPVSGRLPIPV